MAIIKTFKAVRPQKDYAHKVAALPYDVMNEQEARQMVLGNPYSFLHIDRSEVDLPEGTDPHSEIVYQKAAENLQKMIADGVFIREPKACFYIYKLTRNGQSQTGLVASTSVDEYINGTIKKHEFTRKDKEQDRICHVDYCNANTGPIFLTYKEDETSASIISSWVSQNSPIYDFISEDGISHTVWAIDDEKVCEKLVLAFSKIENLYIADGHHRNASACAVALKRREQYPNYTGQEEFNFYLSVLFPANELKILDYNRVVFDLNNHTKDEFLAEIEQNFDVTKHSEKSPYKPQKPKEFGMYLDDEWYILKAKQIPTDIVKSLDVSILQEQLLTPILGISDPRTDRRIDFVGGIRGLKELEERVKNGAKVAFSMYPTSIDELMEISDIGEVMPPKSTWFEPKLRSGIFIHELD